MKFDLECIVRYNNLQAEKVREEMIGIHGDGWLTRMWLNNFDKWVEYNNRRISLNLFNEDFLAFDDDTKIVYIREE